MDRASSTGMGVDCSFGGPVAVQAPDLNRPGAAALEQTTTLAETVSLITITSSCAPRLRLRSTSTADRNVSMHSCSTRRFASCGEDHLVLVPDGEEIGDWRSGRCVDLASCEGRELT